MEVFVGTSGWVYDWNPDGFDWYVRNSGFNAVELNMSFYRYPFPRQVMSWARKSRGKIRWAIKVNRLITHRYRLSDKALKAWEKFKNLFAPLDDSIDFYLFQMPPSFLPKETNIRRVVEFAEKTGLGWRFALELRHPDWITKDYLDRLKSTGITVVSVDAPEFSWYLTTNGIVYLRMHGRTSWYAHHYTVEELTEVAEKIIALKPQKIYVFFNNNHDMLENGRQMLAILIKLIRQ